MISTVRHEMKKVMWNRKYYVILILLIVSEIVGALYLNHQTKDSNALEYAYLYITALRPFYAIIIVYLSVDMLGSEYQNKTIRLDLVRPITRGGYIRAKFLTLILLSLLLILFIILTSILIGGAPLGWDLAIEVGNHNLVHEEALLFIIKFGFLMILPTSTLIAFSLFIVISIQKMTVSLGVCLGLVFLFILMEGEANLRSYLPTYQLMALPYDILTQVYQGVTTRVIFLVLWMFMSLVISTGIFMKKDILV